MVIELNENESSVWTPGVCNSFWHDNVFKANYRSFERKHQKFLIKS